MQVTDTPTAFVIATDTPKEEAPPVETGPSSGELAQEGLSHVKKAGDYYEKHDCDNWIPESEQARNKCTEAIQRDPANPLAYYCLGKAHFYLGELPEAVENFKKALNYNLTGEERDETEEIVDELEQMLSASPCSIGPIVFEACGQPTKELSANWELIGTCSNTFTVKWLHEYQTKCHHPYGPDDHSRYEGSRYSDDNDEFLETGKWTVQVVDGGRILGEASCQVP
jgi:tetratricopeptide (TPR) repeat protein